MILWMGHLLNMGAGISALVPIGDITVRIRVDTTNVMVQTTSDMSAYGSSWVTVEYTKA